MAPPERPEPHGESPSARSGPLIPQDERDKLSLRLQQSLSGFVDGHTEALRVALRAYREVTERLLRL